MKRLLLLLALLAFCSLYSTSQPQQQSIRQVEKNHVPEDSIERSLRSFDLKDIDRWTPRRSPTLGHLVGDVPVRVERNKSFRFDIWLAPKEPSFSGEADVFMEQSTEVKYEPRRFTLKPGERKTIEASIVTSRSGFSRILATSVSWGPLNATVDSGFRGRLASTINGPIEANRPHSFTLELVDENNQSMPLDTDMTLVPPIFKI